MLVSFAGVDRISLENREFGLYLQLRRTITRTSTGVSFAAIWVQVLAYPRRVSCQMACTGATCISQTSGASKIRERIKSTRHFLKRAATYIIAIERAYNRSKEQ